MAEAELAEDLLHMLIERLGLDLIHAVGALPVVATDSQLAVLFYTVLTEDHFAVAALAGLNRNTLTDEALQDRHGRAVEVCVDLVPVLVFLPFWLV